KTSPNEYLKLFVTQQIADRQDVGEVWDTIMCLRDEQRKAEAKLVDLQYWLTVAEEEIEEKQKQLK
ncbi:hypothetical protein Tco_1558351, partial [Tanacetum coccineum]